jgi:hypothetical protein
MDIGSERAAVNYAARMWKCGYGNFLKNPIRRYALLFKNKKTIMHIKTDITIKHCDLLKYLSSIITEQHVSSLNSQILKYSSLKYRKVIKGIQAHIEFLFLICFILIHNIKPQITQTKKTQLAIQAHQVGEIKEERSATSKMPIPQSESKESPPASHCLVCINLLDRCLSGGQRNQATIE